MKNINWKEVGFPRAIYMIVYLHLFLEIDLPPLMTELLERDWARFDVFTLSTFPMKFRSF